MEKSKRIENEQIGNLRIKNPELKINGGSKKIDQVLFHLIDEMVFLSIVGENHSQESLRNSNFEVFFCRKGDRYIVNFGILKGTSMSKEEFAQKLNNYLPALGTSDQELIREAFEIDSSENVTAHLGPEVRGRKADTQKGASHVLKI